MAGNTQPALTAIQQAAKANGLAWQPLAAVAHYESGLDPTALGDGGHAFGLFQNNNAGGTITGDPNPRRFFNPNVSATYAARAVKGLNIQGLSPQQQVAEIVNRYERPAKPQPEIAGAQQFLSTLGQPGAGQPTPATPRVPLGAGSSGVAAPASNPLSLAPLQQSLQLGQQANQRALDALGQISGVHTTAAEAPNLSALIQQQPAQAAAPAHPTTVNLHPSAPVPSHLDPQAQKAVELAKTYLGTKYVFGGASPKTGFDCSGLLQWTYAKLGVNIPRTSEQQWHAGTPVAKGAIQPGDAVFFVHPGGDVGHVGMAIGNGQYIEAPHTGDVVKIANLADASNFIGARRFA